MRLKRIALLLAVLAAIIPGGQSAQADEPETPFEMRVPVLMYHRIACTRPNGTWSGLFICPDRVNQQMAALEAAGWHTVTADEFADALLEHRCLLRQTFVITVDDGALDGYENGAPIFEAHGFRGTFALVAGKLGDGATHSQKPHFTWDQARDLVARGHGIANHTMWHVSLRSMSSDKLQFQVLDGQDLFEAELGFRPETLVYPHGSFSESTAEQVAPYFKVALTTRSGGLHSTENRTELPRVRVSRSTSTADLLERMQKYAQPCP